MTREPRITDEELLAVARTLFLEHGAHLSTQVVAQHVGLSQATLFKRFGTKMELMRRALVSDLSPDFLSDLARGPSPEVDLREQLTELGIRISAFLERVAPRVAVLKAGGVCLQEIFAEHEVPPPVLAHRLLTQWFAKADALGLATIPEPASAAHMLMGGLQSRIMQHHFFGSTEQNQVVLQSRRHVVAVVELLCRGCNPRTDGAHASRRIADELHG